MGNDYTDLLLEAGRFIHKAESTDELYNILLEYIVSALEPDLSCIYQCGRPSVDSEDELKLVFKKGFESAPKVLKRNSELVLFLEESKELVCLNSRKESPFIDILLSDTMESGIAVPFFPYNKESAVFIVNSMRPFYFKSGDISFLEYISIITKDQNK